MERLAYRNRFVREIVQELENYSEADCEGKTPQVISGSDNLVILRVSYDEWIQLQSSVSTGSDICYPDISDSVRWILNRAVECPVDLCDVIANAILTCEDVQDALAQAILTSDDIRRAIEIAPGVGAPMGAEQLGAPINADSGCDLDVVFAQITGIVDQMDINNRDFLEIMSVASTPGKRLAQVITAIPVLETLPVDDIVAYVAKLYDEIVANYNAQWTTAVRDEYRCGLFCIARDNPDCELTYDDVFNYINGRLENAVSVGNLVGSVVQYTLLGTWSGTTVVDIMMLNQIAIWRAAGNWLGVNLRSLQAVTQLSGNIPDSDWELLCTECPPEDWCRSITGSDLESMFEPNGGLGPQAEWTGTGWGANDAVIPARITLEGDMGANYTIRSVRLIFSGTNAVGDTNDVTIFTEDFISAIGSETFTQDTLVNVTETSLQIFELDVVSSFAPTTVPITVQIDEIQITGTGTEPTFGTAC